MIRYDLDVLVMLASGNTRASELRLIWAGWSQELQTKVREDFTITEKAPTRAVFKHLLSMVLILHSVLNVKVLVAAFNQEKALVGVFL